MIRNILNILKCPLCNGNKKLAFKKTGTNKKFDGVFSCAHNHTFYCKNSIIDFVEKETKVQKIYNEIWKLNTKVIFRDHLNRYENELNKYVRMPEKMNSYFKNKVILDAGCGVGRFSYLIKTYKPKLLFSVDFSKGAVLQTRANLDFSNNNIIIRADLNNLPFRKNKFDFVLSLGVIHHNRHPNKTFDKLVTLVKKNAFISIYIYKKYSLSFLQNLIRPITLKISRSKIKYFCEIFGFTSSKKVKINIKRIFNSFGRLDLLGIRNITYEGLTTPFLYSYSLSEIEKWFKKNHLKIISKTNIISMTGKK